MNDVNTFIEAWADAERDGDAVTADRLLTDDFVGIGPLGFELAKSAWLQRQTIGGLHYDRLSLDEISTRVRRLRHHHRPMERPGQRGRPSHPGSGPGDAGDRQGPQRLATREHPLQLHRRNRRRPR